MKIITRILAGVQITKQKTTREAITHKSLVL